METGSRLDYSQDDQDTNLVQGHEMCEFHNDICYLSLCKEGVVSALTQITMQQVAAVSGDVRRVLELVRRATELAQAEGEAAQGKGASGSANVGPAQGNGASGPGVSPSSGAGSRVTMRHVDGALEQMFGSMHIQLSQNACRLEKILLASLLLEIKARGGSFFFTIGAETYQETSL